MSGLFPDPDAEFPADLIAAGDCVELMAALPDRSIDLIFADPPFNIGYDYDIYDDARTTDEYLEWCRRWGREVARLLTSAGTFWLAIGNEFAAELKVLFHRELGLSMRSWVIWYYTFGVNCKAKLTPSHTHLLYFTRDREQFTFNPDAIKVPSARQLVYGDKRAKAGGRLPDDTWILRPQDVPGGIAPDSDTWHVSRVCGTYKEREGFHSCQMPERVLGRIIRACSDPGDVVLDPFSGSGTTAAVAKKLGRRWLGFELSPEYAEKSRERLAAINPGDPLAGDDEWFAAGKSSSDGAA
jgi:site-specific DNA-methyltransferase (adenine-specific)